MQVSLQHDTNTAARKLETMAPTISSNNIYSTLASYIPRYANGTAPEYSDADDIECSYEPIYTDFLHHDAKSELEAILQPFLGKINRILVAGLGSPESGDKGIFTQVAMMHHAKAFLQGPDAQNPRKIEVLQYEPCTTEMDKVFLSKVLGMSSLDYEYMPDVAKALETYKISIRDRNGTDITCKRKSWPERSHIEKILAHTTASTLLFMPNLPCGVTLRVVNALPKPPALVITNQLKGLWQYAVLTQKEHGYVDDEDFRIWGEVWENVWNGWERLAFCTQRRDMAKFREFTKVNQKFCAYVPWPIDKSTKPGWIRGKQGLLLDIKEAEDAFVEG